MGSLYTYRYPILILLAFSILMRWAIRYQRAKRRKELEALKNKKVLNIE